MPIVAFDIETVPDADLLRTTMSLPDAGDEEVIGKAREKALESSGGRSDFLRLVHHKVVVVAAVIRTNDGIHVDSKGPPDDGERAVVEGFYRLVDRHEPTLVSWNGLGYDLPVLGLRAMMHGVVSPTYWQGPGDKWNQYTSRFHEAHHDLMDILAHRQASVRTSLENLSLACGLPGKMGYGGGQVLEMYREERFSEIRAYCEIDTLNTYLLWLRFRLVSGHLTDKRHAEEIEVVERYLATSDKPHLKEFLEKWLVGRKAAGS